MTDKVWYKGSGLLPGRSQWCMQVFLVLIVAGLISALFSACGDDPEPAESQVAPWEDPKYADWQWYAWDRVKIFHPPNHLHLDDFQSMSKNYLNSIDQISHMLAMDAPQDTLIIFYYTGFGQGREFTGTLYPYVEDGVIHFWLPSFPGPTLVDWLLPKWVEDSASYPFLRHGLRALFDFSGQNYHQATYNNLRDTLYVPLAKLPTDTTISSDEERVQSAEAASFIAYVLANYGAIRLRTMYQYDQPFDVMIRDLFQKPVDSLEQDWLRFAFQHLPDSVQTEAFLSMAHPDSMPLRSQEL